MTGVHLDLHPLRQDDIPEPESPEFQQFLDEHFAGGIKLIETMSDWDKHSLKHDSTVQILNLSSSSSLNDMRKSLGIREYWCGRRSLHTAESLRKLSHSQSSHPPAAGNKRDSGSFNPMGLVRNLSHRLTRRSDDTAHGDRSQLNGSAIAEDDEIMEPNVSEEERQAKVMSTPPHDLYERFRRGLLEYHSENEREYIESCRETECLHVYKKHVAEVWRLTYKTPPPTNPRTFVVLLLSRELITSPPGERSFMNISLPFVHPDCPEKKGGEKGRVRGKYVSVERVKELEGGRQVEWSMVTSSDAGGNIPRFVTNRSLPSSIAEDVPSFLSWMVRRFPEGGNVASKPVAA
ncbi:uncharacterized protein L203_102025 [Cryptococcus depauperatus CBS 7841]|uniref:Uncharacterized protein n=1 Tax=Cryptococcus depauperatus CBS 7841 TaxID=1295531 RepID=A0A1E3IT33_9TREE|nr:hypothetical protein L203_01278 [Cryptococcus depauperatus CBS 7841]